MPFAFFCVINSCVGSLPMPVTAAGSLSLQLRVEGFLFLFAHGLELVVRVLNLDKPLLDDCQLVSLVLGNYFFLGFKVMSARMCRPSLLSLPPQHLSPGRAAGEGDGKVTGPDRG